MRPIATPPNAGQLRDKAQRSSSRVQLPTTLPQDRDLLIGWQRPMITPALNAALYWPWIGAGHIRIPSWFEWLLGNRPHNPAIGTDGSAINCGSERAANKDDDVRDFVGIDEALQNRSGTG